MLQVCREIQMVGLATDFCNEHTEGPTSITHQGSGGHHDTSQSTLYDTYLF